MKNGFDFFKNCLITFFLLAAAFAATIAVNYVFTFLYFALNFTIPENFISGIIKLTPLINNRRRYSVHENLHCVVINDWFVNKY